MRFSCFRHVVMLLFAVIHPLAFLSNSFGQSTVFSYQGRLNDGGGSVNGVYDFTFSLYDAATNGNLIAGPLTNTAVVVTNGLFTAAVDFGASFNGADRFMELGVCSNGVGGFSILAPRQPLTTVPYAISATYLSGVLMHNTVNTTNGATVSGGSDNSANANYSTVGGGIRNNAAGAYSIVAGGYANSLRSDSDFIGGGSYNNIETNTSYAVIGGGYFNLVSGATMSVVAGGQQNVAQNAGWNTIGGGLNNTVVGSVDWVTFPPALYYESSFATIAGGWGNYVTNAFAGSVNGGLSNVLAFSDYGVVGGGWSNQIQVGFGSTIGGGVGNIVDGAWAFPIRHVSPYAVIAGGLTNSVGPDVYAATISGGAGNVVQGLSGIPSSYGAIGGGLTNLIGTSAHAATIGGGEGNIVRQASDYGTIAGGQQNQAGHLGAVGGGYLNFASGGSTVAGGGGNYADGTLAAIGGGGDNQAHGDYSFIGGGYGNYTAGSYSGVAGGNQSAANGDFSFAAGRHAQANHQGTFVWADSTDTLFASAASNTFVIRASGGVGIGKPNPASALDVAGAISANQVSASGTITANQVSASGSITANQVSASGSISANQVYASGSVTANQVTATGNLIGNQVLASGVSIGVSAPDYPLDVAGRMRSRDAGGLTPGIWLQTAHSFGSGGVADIAFFGVLDATRIGFYGHDPRGGSGWGLTYDTYSGNVGIGTSTGYPTYKLQVNGSVGGVGNYNNISDSRYKKNVATLDNALNKVMRLRGVSYDWKQDEYPDLNFDNGPQIGFIAQEICEVLPEVVSTDAAGVQSVAYSKVVPVLVEAIKDQQRDLEALSESVTTSAEASSRTVRVLSSRLERAEAEIAELKETVNELRELTRTLARSQSHR